MNILFIKWKSMGDVVFTLPAIGWLRANFPEAKITYFTTVENAPIVAAFREVSEVIVLDRGVYKQRKLGAMGLATAGLVKGMRRGKFSLVVDTQCYTESAFLVWLTRAPQRWGFRIGRRLRRWAYTHSLPRPADCHPADANLRLLSQFGLKPAPIRNELRLSEQGRKEAQTFLAQHGLDAAARLVFIQPFTSSWHKNWTLENSLAVAKDCRAKGTQVIFGGGPRERELLEPAITAGFPVAAGLPLATVAWLVNHAELVLGMDTGLIHLAVAMGKRVLMLLNPYGPGTPFPYGHPEWIVSPPGGGRVADIPVERVIEAIGKVQLAR